MVCGNSKKNKRSSHVALFDVTKAKYIVAKKQQPISEHCLPSSLPSPPTIASSCQFKFSLLSIFVSFSTGYESDGDVAFPVSLENEQVSNGSICRTYIWNKAGLISFSQNRRT